MSAQPTTYPMLDPDDDTKTTVLQRGDIATVTKTVRTISARRKTSFFKWMNPGDPNPSTCIMLVDSTYEEAVDILKEIASEAGLTIEELEDSPTFTSFTLV